MAECINTHIHIIQQEFKESVRHFVDTGSTQSRPVCQHVVSKGHDMNIRAVFVVPLKAIPSCFQGLGLWVEPRKEVR